VGDRSIRANLFQKGVSRELVDEALEEAGDESERAGELARRRAVRLATLGPDAAHRRLYAFLLRRGYGPGIAREACRSALLEVFGEGPTGQDP
jgi:regulatory protein